MCLVAAMVTVPGASAQDATPPPPPPGAPPLEAADLALLHASAERDGSVRVMVRVDPSAGDPTTAVESTLAGTDFASGQTVDDIVAVEVDPAGLDLLAASPQVIDIAEDVALSPAAVDPGAPNGAWLHTIGADLAHQAGFDGSGVRVALIDTGVDLDHPALAGATVATEEACFVTDATLDPCPDDGDADPHTSFGPGVAAPCVGAHCQSGTYLASIAVGRGSSGVPVGVAPEAQLIAVRVFQTDLDGSVHALMSDVYAAVDHLAALYDEDRIDVLLIAFGQGAHYSQRCSEPGDPIARALEDRLGLTDLVGAAGDEGHTNSVQHPACAMNAITATGPFDMLPDWANRRETSALGAPGIGITGATPGGGSATYSGTAPAAAVAAGAYALLRQQGTVVDRGGQLFTTGVPAYGAVGGPIWIEMNRARRIDVAAALGLRPVAPQQMLYVFDSGVVRSRRMEGTSMQWLPITDRIVGAASVGHRRWYVQADGRVIADDRDTTTPHFGDRAGQHLNSPITAMAATPSGNGYWLLAEDGGIFTYGDATFYGSTGNMRLNAPVTDIATTPSGRGYWLTAKDGGVFTFGDAGFYGSTGSMTLNQPVVSMDATASGKGYWLVALDGGVFTFGDASFHGSLPGAGITQETGYRVRATADGEGYYIATLEGGVYPFGAATFFGHATEAISHESKMVEILLAGG